MKSFRDRQMMYEDNKPGLGSHSILTKPDGSQNMMWKEKFQNLKDKIVLVMV